MPLGQVPLIVFVLFAAAFVATVVSLRLFIKFAPELRAIAHPTDRGTHAKSVPTGAGIVILAVILIVLTIFQFTQIPQTSFWSFALTASMISIAGFVDDIRPLPLLFRLLLQLAAVSFFVYASGPYTFPFSLGEPWSSSLTVLAIVGLINVFNFMDGSDGIASLHALIIFGGWACLSYIFGGSSVIVVSLAFVAALSGFLIYNWHPAKVFLGDAGSTLIGFSVAAIPLIGSDKTGNQTITPVWPIVFFSWIFIFDAGYSRLKRVFTASRFWEPNRDHFYQRLIDSGRSQPTVAAMYGGVTAISVILTVFAVVFGGPLFFTLAVIIIGVPLLLFWAGKKKKIDLSA